MNKGIYLGALTLFCSIFVRAQNHELAISSIPFNLIGNKYVLIESVIYDQDTLTFYFDIGATSSLIDKSSAERLGIQPNYEQEVSGAGGKTKYQIALNQKITINDVELDSVHLVLEDLARLKSALEHPFDGIIGYSLVKEFITELDFDNQVIRLYPKAATLDLSSYSQHEFSFDNGIPIPQLEVEIELENSNKYRGNVFFDSGAGLSLLVNTPFKEKNNLVKQVGKILSSSSENLSKESVSQQIAIKQLKIGEYYFSDLPIDLASEESGVSSYEGYLGILGAKIINRFNIVLDYDEKKMYLKPNHLYRNAFEFTLTGFSIRENNEGEVYISKISEESPAYKKGIREGDIVVSVNKNSNGNLAEYRELFKRKGKRIKILLKQKQKVKKYKLKLKKLL